MNTTALVEQLKAAGQDFEFYPTTKEMVRAIWEHRRKQSKGFESTGEFGDVLDIGCGTCNFKRWIAEFNRPLEKIREDHTDTRDCVTIRNYYVIEKSRILIDRLDPDSVVLGTDFHSNTLIDKPVDTVFCNPPYSEYEEWTSRIIRESVCNSIYLIIPQRWKQSEKIQLALKTVSAPFSRKSDYTEKEPVTQVIGSFDFENAERSARAKVDIVFINKEYTSKTSGFDNFFEEVFGMPGPDEKRDSWKKEQEIFEEKKREMIAGRNKIELLCNGYREAQKTLFEHFRAICGLDTDILNTIGIEKKNVKTALKNKVDGLKTFYWNLAFDCLEEITSRLTSTSRKALRNRFENLRHVDFNESNIYALIVWVIKNANTYYKQQMIDFFTALSSPENVRNYKSNERLFQRNKWGYSNRKHDHYTLDYRIVCTKHALPGGDGYRRDENLQEVLKYKISDICTVACNLGFPAGLIDLPACYGEKGVALTTLNGDPSTELFTFRCYQNGNVHVKFNKEFMKALNVEVSRELGWIHGKEDIAREFTPEMAAGAEKYFDRTFKLDLQCALQLTAAEQAPEIKPEQRRAMQTESGEETIEESTEEMNLFNYKEKLS